MCFRVPLVAPPRVTIPWSRGLLWAKLEINSPANVRPAIAPPCSFNPLTTWSVDEFVNRCRLPKRRRKACCPATLPRSGPVGGCPGQSEYRGHGSPKGASNALSNSANQALASRSPRRGWGIEWFVAGALLWWISAVFEHLNCREIHPSFPIRPSVSGWGHPGKISISNMRRNGQNVSVPNRANGVGPVRSGSSGPALPQWPFCPGPGNPHGTLFHPVGPPCPRRMG